MHDDGADEELRIEPFFAEAVGRLKTIMIVATRRYDLLDLSNGRGEPFRFIFDLDMGDRFGIVRRGDHFAVRIGLTGVRTLAAMCEQVAMAVVISEEGPRGHRVYPAVTGERVDRMDGFAQDLHVEAWQQLAATCERPFAAEDVRAYLVEAALTFLVHHELAHGHLGHVDAMGSLLPGLTIEEGELSRRLSFTGALRGIESAADVAGFNASLHELVERDVFQGFPDQLWACGNVRFSLRLVGCFLVPLLWHGKSEAPSDHPSPLARFLAIAALGLDGPDHFPERLRAGFDGAIRNAVAILSNAGRRLTWIEPMWDLAPKRDFASIRDARMEAKSAMADVIATVERYEYTERA